MVLKLIYPDGWRFIALFAGVAVFLACLSETLGWIGALLTAWCLYFFRNPSRVTPEREGIIVSPADGKVVSIQEVSPPVEWEIGTKPRIRVSIFLSVFDVHVNRIPIRGTVQKVLYHPGLFLNASLDKASEKNERNTVILEIGSDQTLAVVQIAGLIARRIRCDVKEGEEVQTGDSYGIIRFGSRMDIYLPSGVNPLVIKGQRMVGGETVLADLESQESPREGRVAL